MHYAMHYVMHYVMHFVMHYACGSSASTPILSTSASQKSSKLVPGNTMQGV